MEIELPGSKRLSHNLQKQEKQQNDENLTVKLNKLRMLYFYDKIYFELLKYVFSTCKSMIDLYLKQ